MRFGDVAITEAGFGAEMCIRDRACIVPAVLSLEVGQLFEAFLLRRGRVVPLRLTMIRHQEDVYKRQGRSCRPRQGVGPRAQARAGPHARRARTHPARRDVYKRQQ